MISRIPCKIYLASKSPRRREFLENLGVNFELINSDFEENLPDTISATDSFKIIEEAAIQKARGAIINLAKDGFILAADTVVILENEILGKPQNQEHAQEMLRKLSGKEHSVVSGVAVLKYWQNEEVQLESTWVKTQVKLRELTGAEINWYLDSNEPYDKAGAYAIQGLASIFVESINGSYTNVVGLPLVETTKLLEKISNLPWNSWQTNE